MPTDVESTPAVESHGDDRYVIAQSSPEFARLRASFRAFVFPMTAAFLTWYLLYVVLSAYARGFMGTTVVGEINVAFVFGILQFVTTFLIAWLYSRYARARMDPAAEAIWHTVEDHTDDPPGGPRPADPPTAGSTTGSTTGSTDAADETAGGTAGEETGVERTR